MAYGTVNVPGVGGPELEAVRTLAKDAADEAADAKQAALEALGAAQDASKTGVTSFNGRTGAVTPQSGDYTAADVGAVPAARKINNKALNADISLTAGDVGARPSTWTPTADDVGAAPKASPEFTGSISLGRKKNTTVGSNSLAVGSNTTASGIGSHAEGGNTTASGLYSHAEGRNTTASGEASHAEGSYTTAKADFTHAGGWYTSADAMCQMVIGKFNKKYPTETAGEPNYNAYFIIGDGGSETSLANILRVGTGGVWAAGSYKTSGADYAELFEWTDGNQDGEDRTGLFVTLDGEKIRLAGPDDDYILGIVSGNPSVVGDVYDDQWRGMYLYDIFGRQLWEDVEVPDELSPDGKIMIPAHTAHRQKLNPDYDGSQTYIPRTERPEWGCVGMLGKLVAVDDGTCQPNGWAAVGENGVATASVQRTKFRVMSRLDESHVRVMVL